jgi:D-sedoheptulose 7-phosphate isomerase
MIRASVRAHREATEAFFTGHTPALTALAERVAALFAAGGTLLLCGNGGSACDAMHIAGEFVGRFQRERRGLPAIALSADSGVLTAIGNDYGFERIFARQIEALGRNGDALIALSTSGGSPNVLAALRQARAQGVYTALFTGEKGADRGAECDALFVVPSPDTARIQEVHLLALHLLADLVESSVAARASGGIHAGAL